MNTLLCNKLKILVSTSSDSLTSHFFTNTGMQHTKLRQYNYANHALQNLTCNCKALQVFHVTTNVNIIDSK